MDSSTDFDLNSLCYGVSRVLLFLLLRTADEASSLYHEPGLSESLEHQSASLSPTGSLPVSSASRCPTLF